LQSIIANAVAIEGKFDQNVGRNSR
jgi:hypothetical protein